MLELADILRQHRAAYQATHRLSPQQRRALRDIEHCRTAYFGGQLWQCDHCGQLRYRYHSCRNRHCPKCHGEQTQVWLQRQEKQLLPCAYYLLTFTLPAPLRALARRNPKIVYSALMKCAAATVLKLTADPRYVGATPTILAVLHTWTRALLYHPHVHLLVSAGGLGADGRQWMEAKHRAFLVPVRALSIIFRAKMRQALGKAPLLQALPARLWKQPWVVHCQHAGRGQRVLDYLGRYLFRVAISNSRLEAFENGRVTFRYRDNRTQQLRRLNLSAVEFIGRFVEHVLPIRFAKVRYYGLASASRKKAHQQAQRLLTVQTSDSPTAIPVERPPSATQEAPAPLCPYCRIGHLILRQLLGPERKIPP